MPRSWPEADSRQKGHHPATEPHGWSISPLLPRARRVHRKRHPWGRQMASGDAASSASTAHPPSPKSGEVRWRWSRPTERFAPPTLVCQGYGSKSSSWADHIPSDRHRQHLVGTDLLPPPTDPHGREALSCREGPLSFPSAWGWGWLQMRMRKPSGCAGRYLLATGKYKVALPVGSPPPPESPLGRVDSHGQEALASPSGPVNGRPRIGSPRPSSRERTMAPSRERLFRFTMVVPRTRGTATTSSRRTCAEGRP